MQPFLSGETTLALLLTVLTLLFFAAAGDEHPYEPHHHKTLPVEAGCSSAVELASVREQPQIIKRQELVVRLVKGLQVHQRKVVTTGKEQQQRGSAELIVGRPWVQVSPKPRLSPSTVITSRLLLLLLRWPRRNLQILAALLSHRSLHTASLSTVLLNNKSDMNWSLEALLGLGLAAKKTTTTTITTTAIPGRSSLRCPKRKKSVRFVDGGHESRGGGGEKKTDQVQQQQQLQGLGSGLRRRSVGDERVVEVVC